MTEEEKPIVCYLKENQSPITVDFFNELGIELVISENSKDFILSIAKRKPKVCFMDLEIPQPDLGWKLAEKIIPQFGKTVPIFLFTKSDKNTIRVKAEDKGFTHTFYQPIDTTELIKRMSAFFKTPRMIEIGNENASGKIILELKDISEIEEFSNPEIIQKYFALFIPLMTKLRACWQDDLEDSEEKLKFYAEIMNDYEDKFMNMVKAKIRGNEDIEFERCIRVNGVENTRNLIFCKGLFECFNPDVDFFNEDSHLTQVKVTDYIKYAVAAEEHFGFGNRYSQVAFMSGLILDFITILNGKVSKNKERINTMIDGIYADGLESAALAFKKAKSGQSLLLEKHVIPASILRQVGNIVFCIYYPEYLRIDNQFDKKNIPLSVQRLWEKEQFNIATNMIAALSALFTPGLHQAYKALLFEDVGFMLQDDKTEIQQLTEICQASYEELNAVIEPWEPAGRGKD